MGNPAGRIGSKPEAPVQRTVTMPKRDHSGSPSVKPVAGQKSSFQMLPAQKLPKITDSKKMAAHCVNILKTPVDLIKNPEKAKIQKLAVRKLFALKAEQELTQAFIFSIENDRPDIFLAILCELTPSGKEWYRDMESPLLLKALRFLNASKHLVRTRETYLLHVAARWIQVKYSSLLHHTQRAEIEHELINLLVSLNMQNPSFWKQSTMVSSSWIMLELLNAGSWKRYKVKRNKLLETFHKGLVRKPDAIVEYAKVIISMVASSPYKNSISFDLKRSVKRIAEKYSSYHSKIVSDPRFLAGSILHANARMIIFSFARYIFDMRSIITTRDAYRMLGHMLMSSDEYDPSYIAIDGMIRIDKKQGYAELGKLLLSSRSAKLKALAERLDRGLHDKRASDELHAMRIVRNIIAVASQGNGVARIHAIDTLGFIRSVDSWECLRHVAKQGDRRMSARALRAYAESVTRDEALRRKPPPFAGPGGYYSIPIVKAPRRATESLQPILIPRGISQSTRNIFDWNKDGYVRGSYERYKLWLTVVQRFNAYQLLRNSRQFDVDPLLRQVAARLKRDIQNLLPMYAHLPQVNIKKQTVRIGQKLIRVRGKSTISQEALFALGEAYSSVPSAMRKWFEPIGGNVGPMLYIFGVPMKRYDAIYRLSYYGIRNKRVSHVARELRVKSTFLRHADIGDLIRMIKHEFGHAMDNGLWIQSAGKRLCRGRSSIPIIGIFIPQRVPCSSLIREWSGDRSYLSESPMFQIRWRNGLRKSNMTPEERLSLTRMSERHNIALWNDDQSVFAYRKLHNNFVSVYGSKDASEHFAETWASYASFVSPWSLESASRTRSDVKTISPLHYRFFKQLEKQYSR